MTHQQATPTAAQIIEACQRVPSVRPSAEETQALIAEIERLRATLQLESEYRRNAVAEATRLHAVVRDAIEAIERGSTSAPILEVLKATLGGTEQRPGD